MSLSGITTSEEPKRKGVAHRRSADEVAEDCWNVLEPVLRRRVDTLPSPTRDLVSYHFGWDVFSDAKGKRTSGKGYRCALALVSASAFGSAEEAGIPGGVAVEFVHNFSLLHDDIMDGDRTRRHRPAAWTVYGIPAAVLAGDALLCLATSELAAVTQASATAILSRGLLSLVRGQSEDIAPKRPGLTTLQRWEWLAQAKTGALLATACSLGGLLGGAAATQVEALDQFGRSLGLAYQATDDLLGMWGDPALTGKPVHNDLLNRKYTLPLVLALNSGGSEAMALRERLREEADLSKQECAWIASCIEQAGGMVMTQEYCRARLDEAIANLALGLSATRARDDLCTLAHAIAGRRQ